MSDASAPTVVSNLLAQIRATQSDVARLRAEKDRCQHLIREYDQLVQTYLGPLLTRLTEIQQALAIQKATQSRRRSDADELTVNSPGGEPQQFRRVIVTANSVGSLPQTPAHNPPLQTIRKLYRQAAALAHPDLFAGDSNREARANEVMTQLNAAYEREDTEAVQQLLDDLQDGLPFLDLPGSEPDAPALERILARLTRTRDALIQEIAVLRQAEAYRIMSDEKLDLTDHLTQLEQRCLNQIEFLMNQL